MPEDTTNQKEIEQFYQKQLLQNTRQYWSQPSPGVCPHCGYCHHCGRGGQHFTPWYPSPYVPTYPPFYPHPVWTVQSHGGLS